MRRKSKSANGAGSIIKRSDGRWEGKYTIGFDAVTGKQKRKSIYGRTKGEVREKLSAIIADIDDGTYIEPCKMPLSEWLDIWLAEYL